MRSSRVRRPLGSVPWGQAGAMGTDGSMGLGGAAVGFNQGLRALGLLLGGEGFGEPLLPTGDGGGTFVVIAEIAEADVLASETFQDVVGVETDGRSGVFEVCEL